MIPHSKPSLGAEEAEALQSVLLSGRIAQGAQVEALEKEMAEYLGLKGAVAVSSGTAALHLALLALGSGENTVVHMPSYVCTALLNAAGYCGAKVSVCDVDPATGNIDPDDLKRRVIGDSDIVIIPHMFGDPAPILPLLDSGLKIIEDCAQSIGATLNNRLVGTFGEISVFSFYATKVLCAGEGGMVASDSAEILSEIFDLRDYDHKCEYRLRFNYKMSEMQAAMARVQLRKLPQFIARRRAIAREYDDVLDSTSFEAFNRPGGNIFFRYLFASKDVPGTIARFRAESITAARPVFKPLHRCLNLKGYPGTDEIDGSAVSIPCYPALTDDQVEQVCRALLKAGSTCSAAH